MARYKAAPTNVNRGALTHGGFKNDGQKAGFSGAKSKIGAQKGRKFAKEKLRSVDPIHARLRKISKAAFGQMKTRQNDVNQRAQFNA